MDAKIHATDRFGDFCDIPCMQGSSETNQEYTLWRKHVQQVAPAHIAKI